MDTLHAMCMLKFEVLLDVFKSLHCSSLGKSFSSCCFLKRRYGVERTRCFDDITHVFTVIIREPSVGLLSASSCEFTENEFFRDYSRSLQ